MFTYKIEDPDGLPTQLLSDRPRTVHTMQTRIIVLDRHALFRRGVVALAREAHADWQCADTDSLTGLREALTSETQVLALVDLDHHELDGLDGLAMLINTYPDHIFVGLSDDDDRSAILSCLTAGARGYMPRATNTTQFVRALETILDGGIFAPATLTAPARPAQGMPLTLSNPRMAVMPELTERQRDVFNLLAEGCPTKTIARRLDLAVGTVKVHLAAIYRTLGATSRLEAVAKAHRGYAPG
jgi:DNA-binding NarL/FixJ family response regulator